MKLGKQIKVYIANLLQQSNLKMAYFSLDHKLQPTGNCVAWTPYYFFIQNRPWSKKGIFQGSHTWVGFNRDITLYDGPDISVDWADI